LIELLILLIAISLFFDFVNGFHDSSNAIATVINTKALSIKQALFLSATLNFIGPFLFGTAVAHTIGTGIVDPSHITVRLLIAALSGAIAWGLATWALGLPSSSSHALVGGIAGSAIAAYGFGGVNLSGLTNIVLALIISPIVGIVIGFAMMVAMVWLFRGKNPHTVNLIFKNLQILSSSFVSLSHGTNDAQKTMGIIAAGMLAMGYIDQFYVPWWVIALSAGAISIGTIAGGWRIIKTVGTRIVSLRPIHGFCAEFSSAMVILAGSFSGLPLSTTHVVSSSIMGVGAVERLHAVRWLVARKIIWTWLLTIPASAAVAAFAYLVVPV